MKPNSKELLKIEMIDAEKIQSIREQINNSNPTASPEQRASLLATAIYELIDETLPNFSAETKRLIRMDLIRQKLSSSSLTISADDIMESSVRLATQEEVEDELHSWAREHTAEKEMKQPTAPQRIKKRQKHIGYILSLAGLALILFFVIQHIHEPLENDVEEIKVETVKVSETTVQVTTPNELPPYLQYAPIDDGKLREWLNGRDSLLAEEPYFSSIIDVANEFNVHPLLLFAITGQEQGFVSKDHKHAVKIANNPFNVFHSWQDFNTDISESSQIAARTIINLSKERPEDVDPIQWINRKYAEDTNWWLGVSAIFQQLQDVARKEPLIEEG